MTDYPPLTPPQTWPSVPTMQGTFHTIPNQPETKGHLKQKVIFGDAMSDAARAKAMNDRGVLANRYNADKEDYDGDVDKFVADKNSWDHVKAAMQIQNPQDFQACYADLRQEWQMGQDEHDQLASCVEFAALGDNDVDQGDALPANQSAQKLQCYQNAISAYASGTDCCKQAESKHASFLQASQATEAILVKYG